MNSRYIIEWTFSPIGFFDEPKHFEKDNYELWIEDGNVKAEFFLEDGKDELKMRDKLHEILLRKFSTVKIIKHKKYQLSDPNMHTKNPKGQRKYLKALGGKIKMHGGHVDFIVTDKDGNIKADTRKDRIDKIKKMTELREKHDNSVLVRRIFDSYEKAVDDQEHELSHLYEIWETLSISFDNEKDALKALRLSKKDRENLTRLANNQNILQSRHPGKRVGEGRNASDKELSDARDAAKKMIKGYLCFLENQN